MVRKPRAKAVRLSNVKGKPLPQLIGCTENVDSCNIPPPSVGRVDLKDVPRPISGLSHQPPPFRPLTQVRSLLVSADHVTGCEMNHEQNIEVLPEHRHRFQRAVMLDRINLLLSGESLELLEALQKELERGHAAQPQSPPLFETASRPGFRLIR